MVILHAPLTILDPLRRVRVPTAAVGAVLYSVRAGQLIRADTTRGPGIWTCRWMGCSRYPQCTADLTDDDLATAVDPSTLTDTGHPDPTNELITYLAAWRSQVWQRLGSRAGALADRLADESGPDTVVHLDRDLYRSYALRVGMLPSGFTNTVARLTEAALLTSINDDERCGFTLTLPPTRHRPDMPTAPQHDQIAETTRTRAATATVDSGTHAAEQLEGPTSERTGP